ncbi:hypothetical protein CNBF0350 [Cryptococcus deneoformans B-3501A]|uniref:hypothetical protein n=1 Tax=Cryptococcus deneoformans (strain B-3501A) TaxID=283643 RepID=UPI000042E7D4|nr:hypothetical protein CNBF0350 [Cryptococcus neoformans var. neoformans B-3501A]EAL20223.1 hypothetical protein CNBF0350 [Cryptococcus neoformans var. neoformans B-3501A]
MKRDWRDVIFTDECALELGGGITRRPNKDYPTRRQSLSYYQKFPHLRLPLAPSTVKHGVRTKAETLNGLRYAEMVIKGVFEGGILRSLRSSDFENILVPEDGAPSYRAAVAK